MKNAIIVLVLVAVVVVVLGFFLGWFSFSSSDNHGKPNITLTVDKDEMGTDKHNVVDAVKGPGE